MLTDYQLAAMRGRLRPWQVKQILAIKAYSPDETRDERGRWATDGSEPYEHDRTQYIAKSRDLFHKLSTTLPPYEKMSEEQKSAYFNSVDLARKDEKDWEHSVREAMSEGKLSYEDAKARGFQSSGHDSDNEGRVAPDGSRWGWQALPQPAQEIRAFAIGAGTSNLRAGGPGSGCHGPNCGRPMVGALYSPSLKKHVLESGAKLPEHLAKLRIPPA